MSNILHERQLAAQRPSLVRSRVRPPELLPQLDVLATGDIPALRARIRAMHEYVGKRRRFTPLELLELAILDRKLSFQLMLIGLEE